MNIRIPNGWLNRWREYFGDEQAKALMLASNQKSPLVVRANLGKTSREKIVSELARTGHRSRTQRSLAASYPAAFGCEH